jgi:hypothetical protein
VQQLLATLVYDGKHSLVELVRFLTCGAAAATTLLLGVSVGTVALSVSGSKVRCV